jgi:hypothetical protein
MTKHNKDSRLDLPRPHRTPSDKTVVARQRAEAPAPEITLGFSDEEPPTADLPKPILKMLVRATMPTEQEATPEPTTAALPATAEAAKDQNSPAKLAERHRSKALALFVGSLIGTLGGAWVWHLASATDPAGEGKAVNAPSHARTVAPAPTPAAAPQAETREPDVRSRALAGAASPRKLETASLLAEDGSESTAPTCDELLAGGSADRRHTWSDHFRAARGALIRGDLDASQRAFCRATGATSAPATVSLELAQLLLLRRDAIAASSWIEQAAHLAPDSARILELKGDAAVRTGNLEEARSAWLRAAGLSADDSAGIDRMLRRVRADADASLRARDPRRAERLLRRTRRLIGAFPILRHRPFDVARERRPACRPREVARPPETAMPQSTC